MTEWIEVTKLLASAAFGFVSSTAIYWWKERKESKRQAQTNYDEALSIAAKNREVAQEGVMMLYEVIQKIQTSPMAVELVEIRKTFQIAAQNIAEPNAKAAEEFYKALYEHDKEMRLKESRLLLKKAKHFLSNNEGANRAMIKKLGMVEVSLQLNLTPQQE